MAANRNLNILFNRSYSLQPAYIIHPRVKITNPQEQLLALTKSHTVETGAPKRFQEFRSNLDVTPWKETIRKNIIYARNFDNQSKFTPHKYPFSLIQNIFKTLLAESPVEYLPILRDLHFIGNTDVTGTWSVKERFFGVRGSLSGTLVKSKRAWPIFYEDDLVKDSENFPISTNIRNTFSNLNKWKVSLKEPLVFPSKYPNIHTVVVIDNQGTSEDQLLQKAVLYIHGFLLKQVRNKFDISSPLTSELPSSQCAQGIITNGKRFSFVWYQLNTLSSDDLSTGIKNLVSIEKPGLLYTTITRERGGVSHVHRKLDNYNEDILKTLLSMFLWQPNSDS